MRLTITHDNPGFGVALDAFISFARSAGVQVDVVVDTCGVALSPMLPQPTSSADARYHAADGRLQRGAAPQAPASAGTAALAPMPPGYALCKDCGVNTHSTDYRRCSACKQARDAAAVACRECGQERHPPQFPRCYPCTQKRKAVAAAAVAQHDAASAPIDGAYREIA